MSLAFDCPTSINLPVIAGYDAQMTAVLAGFAFTAMVVILTPRKPAIIIEAAAETTMY
jgi:hypothetical protein